MEFLNNDYTAIITAIVTLASAFVNWTDTPKDDGLFKKIYSVIEFLAMVNYKAKQK
jgi:hypothetical protein